MNHKKFLLTMVTLLILSLMSASIATAGAPRSTFSATAEMKEMIDPGTTEIRDNHVHVRGMKQAYETCWTYDASGETVCYREVVEANVVISLADMTGTMWGSFKFLDDNNAVVWKGKFHGSRRIIDENMVSTVTDIGLGQGPNEGLLFQYTLKAYNIWDPSQPATFAGKGFVQETSN